MKPAEKPKDGAPEAAASEPKDAKVAQLKKNQVKPADRKGGQSKEKSEKRGSRIS